MPVLLAPAKINLTLEILSRRADGYHTLRSVMLPIGLYDRIVIEAAAGSESAFSCGDDSLANDNLVMRALALARRETPFDVRLEKNVPVGGGLGGGSSDAASVLRAAMSGALGRGADDIEWSAAARSLGSDVPFFLTGTGALVEGTGERVTPIGALPAWWVVVARPHAFVPTAHAYGLIATARDRDGAPPTRARGESVSLAAVDALQRHDFHALEAALQNDFDAPIRASYPAVEATTRALAAAGAPKPLLSGSGSCVFALFENEAAARSVATACEPSAVDALFVVPLHRDEAWR